MIDNEEEWVSKTQMKKQMNHLQDLGMELTKLSNETLKKIGLDEDLYEAVQSYKKITSNSALKRQAQYIGRLMRDTDPEPIERYLAKLRGDNAAHNAFLQRAEQARERLIADDDALTTFMADYPQADAGRLRTLIRNTRKEREQNKPPKSFRALFQEVKAVMEGSQSSGDAADDETDFAE
ncbi:ribosome biogenesis factor YjgA [Neisseria yangbaofengii]|uniref:ribosome biogenesis factor YjgA n=1 Tax=Neisseria yangbaofengii TaxID=2709396 RepID=UPI0013EC61F6|nr:ribosome biogenesis factor YjgA [Neisseria yangbaofengii]